MILKLWYIIFIFFVSGFSQEIIRIDENFHSYFKDQKSLRILEKVNLKPTERLLFDLNWGIVNAGQATLELLKTNDDSLLIIRIRAWCNSFFQTFYPVQDTIFSIIDKEGFYPLRYEKRIHEGGYHANVSILFNQKKESVYTEMRRPEKAVQDSSFKIPPFSYDILSSFYALRMIDFKVGDTINLDVVSGLKQYQLKVICHRKEKVKVPAGEFESFVIEPRIKGVGLFNAKGTLHIWITADSSRIPVKMRTKIPVGSIEAKLIEIHRSQE